MTHLEKSLSKLRKDVMENFDVIDGVLDNMSHLGVMSKCLQNDIDKMRVEDLKNNRNSYTADFHQKHLDKTIFLIECLLNKIND